MFIIHCLSRNKENSPPPTTDHMDTILKQATLKLNMLKATIEAKEGLLVEDNAAFSNTYADHRTADQQSQIDEQTVKIRELVSECDSVRASLLASEKLVDELSEQWDGLSLRAKIVSAFKTLQIHIYFRSDLIYARN